MLSVSVRQLTSLVNRRVWTEDADVKLCSVSSRQLRLLMAFFATEEQQSCCAPVMGRRCEVVERFPSTSCSAEARSGCGLAEDIWLRGPAAVEDIVCAQAHFIFACLSQKDHHCPALPPAHQFRTNHSCLGTAVSRRAKLPTIYPCRKFTRFRWWTGRARRHEIIERITFNAQIFISDTGCVRLLR